ncbi:MAG: YibE/F family protein [Actinomycetota bacterium]|nr:YibE/F family protein [Actinomycetota bacterium]
MRGVTHRMLLAVVGLAVVVMAGGMAVLWPDAAPDVPPTQPSAQTTSLVDATVLEVTDLGPDPTGLLPGATTVAVSARLDRGGETVAFEMTDDTGGTYHAGQRVKLAVVEQDGQKLYYISDFRRDRPMLVLVALFFAAVIGFGRWQGARALLGLALTFVVIVGFIVPAVLDGRSPVAVAVVGSIAIMVVTLYLSHGWSRKTTAAVVGTAFALLLTAVLAAVFVAAASITGFTSEEARLANYEVGGLSLRGLLLAGIILGGLGVLDDVTMSQASTVFELHRANPRTGFGDLMRGALTVGRDHVAATVNTLFLAYAGASLPLLILFSTSEDPLGTILTAEVVAVEIIRTLVGSVGLIAAVPLTTALAAAVVLGEPEATAREAGESAHPHGHTGARTPTSRRPRRARGGSLPAARGGEPAGQTGPPNQASPKPRGEVEQDDVEWVQRLRAAYRLPPEEADKGA